MSMRPANWYDVELNLGVIGDAFSLLFRRWQEYALLGFITLMVSMVFVIPGYFLFISAAMSFSQPDMSMMLSFYGLIYGGIFLGMVVSYPFMFGIVSFTLREVQYGDATLADAWRPLRKFGRYAVAGLVLAFLQGVAMIVGCILGGFVVSGLFLYVMPIMVHEELSLGDAIKESVDRLKSQWLMAALAYIVIYFVATVGQYACGIGILLTYPLIYVIPAMLYLRHLPAPQQAMSESSAHSPYPRQVRPGYGAPQMQRGIGDESPAPPKEEEKPQPPTDQTDS